MFHIEKDWKIIGTSDRYIIPQEGEKVFSKEFSQEETAKIKKWAEVVLTKNGVETIKVMVEKEVEEEITKEEGKEVMVEKEVEEITQEEIEVEKEITEMVEEKLTAKQIKDGVIPKIIEKKKTIKIPETKEVITKVKKQVPVMEYTEVTEKIMVTKVLEEEIEIDKFDVEIIENAEVTQELIDAEKSVLFKLYEDKVEEFLKQYPPSERTLTFDTKAKEAVKVLAGEDSAYLQILLDAKNAQATEAGIPTRTLQEYATLIKQKADGMAQYFAQLEVWKDVEEHKINLKYNVS